MEISVIHGDITTSRSNAIVLSYFEGQEQLEEPLATVDRTLEGAVSQMISRGEIKGKFKEITTIYTLGKLPGSLVVITGLGKKSEVSPDKIRTGTAEVCKLLRQKSLEIIDLNAPGAGIAGLSDEDMALAITEGALLGTYTFRKHITRPPDYKEIQQLNIIESDESRIGSLERGCRKGRIIAEATIFARDMVNEPANVVTPAAMAEAAQQMAIKHNLDIKVLESEEMQQLGMGGISGVAQGSQQPPKFIILRYKGKESDELDIALVGKGITFDSGGISIKPSENLGEMKSDMAGGASVLGAIGAIAQLKPAVNVAAIVPATENLPSGTAMRPGDIITIMNGKTVEIISTDAEGRLVLADALSYARQMGAERLVDVATLTGACRIALGDFCTGAFGNNQDLVNRIIAAGTEVSECVWQMPMNEEYKESNKSDVADIKNTGGRYAGAITAALFLSEFVENIPWVHLDIAGTSMSVKERGYLTKGATGVPVRTLVNLVLSLE